MRNRALLFIGRNAGTSRHRARAFERLGYDVCVIDPFAFFSNSRLVEIWTWHTGSFLLENYVRRNVLASIPAKPFDLAYVDGGEVVGPSLVLELKSRFGTVINYNIDDPYGPRDGRRWRLYSRAVPFYDLIVVVRECNVAEAYAAGAQKVMRTYMSADEVAHSPRPMSEQESHEWATEVAFVGTWMPERGPFLARLVELGVPLSIYGQRWHKAREWSVLRPCWQGPGVYEDRDYAAVIQCAKVSLGLLSSGNRDLSTTRSFEVPLLGGVLCAERTSEHLQLYEENEEAVFWSSPEECAQKCAELLGDTQLRRHLGTAGRHRCLRNRTTNENVVRQILHRAISSEQQSESGNPVFSAEVLH